MPTKRVFNPEDYAAVSPFLSDTAKLQRAFKDAIAACGNVYIPYIGRPWLLEDTIDVGRANNDYVEVNVQGDSKWNLIDFKPKDPATKTAFNFRGHKGSTVRQIKIRTYGDDLKPFLWSGPPNSNGGCIYEHLRVQPMQGSYVKCFYVGEGGDDYSFNTWHHCEAYCDSYTKPFQDPSVLDDVNQTGHIGFSVVGGNNLFQKIDTCAAVGMKVAVTQLPNPSMQVGASGGNGMVINNFGTTGCCLIYQFNGGFSAFVDGGRHELGGALLSHGTISGWEPAIAPLALRNLVIDAFSPNYGWKGLYEKGAFISLKSAGDLLLDSITGREWNDCYMVLAHNHPTHISNIEVVNCAPGITSMRKHSMSGSWSMNGGLIVV